MVDIEIKKPPKEILEKWQAQLQRCMDFEIDLDLVLYAYYFEYAYILGLNNKILHQTTNYVKNYFKDKDGNFSDILYTTQREGMMDAISIFKTGKPCPRYGNKTDEKN